MSLHGPFAPLHGEPTRLLLLRHGEVEEADRQYLYGQRDVRLSELGIQQSRAAADALRCEPIAAAYSSDLSRARFLAEEIAKPRGLRPRITPLLRERGFGHWEWKLRSELEREAPEELARYRANQFTMRAPGASENFMDVRARVLGWLKEARARHPGQTIAVAAHSGPCRIILADAFQMPLSSIFHFEQEYCCLNEIAYYPNGRARVRRLNETIHHGRIVMSG